MKRLGIGAVVLIAYAALCVVIAVGVPDPRCPEGECAPPDDAVGLVPADALAYAHADLSEDSEELADGLAVVAELPQTSSELARRAQAVIALPDLGGVGFEEDIAPWIGEEAAVALIASSGGPPEPLLLLEIADRQGAEDFASGLGASRQTIELDGVTIDVDARGTARAAIAGFLAVGPEQAVRRAAETAAGGASGSLGADPALALAQEELPAARVADLFISRDGIETLVGEPRAPLATFAPFVAPASSQGFFAAVGADPGSLRIEALSVIDPELDDAEPSFFSAFPGFEPELDSRIPADALAYVGVGDPGNTFGALLEQATSSAPDIAAGFDELARRIGSRDVDPAPALQRAFVGEAALALLPPIAAEESDPEAAVSPVPSLALIAELADPDGAREALAALQIPLAEALGGGVGGASFEETEIEGVTASSIEISPTLSVAYAIAGETLAAASSQAALGELIGGDGGLAGSERFERALGGTPGEPLLRLYLDLAGLIGLGERFGLGADPVYAQLAPEIRLLQALGLTVSRDGDLLRTDLDLLVAEAD
ncbi:DUF3352 domain-containing protein [Thermoleophilia bacterium SCSIO 60948]|nr:DUF3352 domain-containing protein [Thermoleophilia bacterium SCSIO 60948]